MKSENIITGSIIFSLIAFLPSGINFLLLPIYTSHLSIEDYGILTLATSISTFFAVIGAFRTSTAINSFYYDYLHSEDTLKIFYGTILKFSFLSNLLIGILLLLPLYFISNKFLGNFFPLGLFSFLIGLISSIRSCFLVYHKNDKDILKYSVQYLLVTITLIVAQLIALMSLELHVEGVLGARLFSEVVGLIAIVFIERKTFLLPFNSDMAIKAFRFSLPLIPSGIIGWIFLFGDRYFISTYLNTQTVGVYGFMITIVSLISLFSDAITHGIQPYLFRYFKESNIQTAQKTNLIAKWYLQAVLLFSFLILLGGFNLNLIIKNTSYLQFQNYLIGGVLVFILDAYTKLFTNRVLFYKKTTFISGISIFSIFITTCLYGGTGKTGRRP